VEFRETLEIFLRRVLRVLDGETLVMIAVLLFDIAKISSIMEIARSPIA
jgi:hypothetical protein